MADSEQAKAALAALADRQPERCDGTATGERRRGEPSGTDHCEGQPNGRRAGEATREGAEVRDLNPERPAGTPAASTAPARTSQPADYRTVIERAVTATSDLDAATEFVESIGLDRLEAAVREAEREVSGLAEEGRQALATFERFRVAAEGPVEE